MDFWDSISEIGKFATLISITGKVNMVSVVVSRLLDDARNKSDLSVFDS